MIAKNEIADTAKSGLGIGATALGIGATIDAVREAIIEEKVSATALAGDFYDRIRREDPEIGAFLTLCEERALAQAAQIGRPFLGKHVGRSFGKIEDGIQWMIQFVSQFRHHFTQD